ncbi:MAG: hypothetical protein ACI9MC_001592 [Kiritimatiellia bacterium]|jgi:hypothetical protein
MKAKWWAALMLGAGLVVGVPVLANGVMGSDAPSRIPVPARDFTAKVEDVGGTAVQLGRFTFNGEVFIYGKFGAGQVTVHFEDITEARIEKASDPLKRIVVIKTKAGETVRVELDDDTPFFGKASFGNYKILVRDLRVVRFP